MANSNFTVKRATQDLVAKLEILSNVDGGITDAGIAAITSSGTVAKLKTYIAALPVFNRDKFLRDQLPYDIDRCNLYGTITDADVETARAAGTFAALLTAIKAHGQASESDELNNSYSVWAQ